MSVLEPLLPVTAGDDAPGRTGAHRSLGDRAARRTVLAALGGLTDGELQVREGANVRRFGCPAADGLATTLEVRSPRFWRRVALGGSLGAAASFLDGEWESDDLVALLRLAARNRAATLGLERLFTYVVGPCERLRHRLRDNTRRGSRRNILAHYDLGNDFFALFLDPTMTYSSALFEHPDMSLEEAQRAKYERICRKLRLTPGETVLEIGTGWGGFAEHAARFHGVRVVTTTISPAQRAWATARLDGAALADRVQVLALDYRDLPSLGRRFDALVSIEMIEAVGHRHLDAFFATCSELLAPHGRMALQAITIRDAFYERAIRSVDFIQRYVFPGGFIPAVSAMTASLARATDLALVHLEDIGPSYAETLHRWRTAFRARRDEVVALGFDTHFLRLWDYYLAYSEAGFRERTIGTAQMVLTKPGAGGPPLGGGVA